jgi:hypothetical protein
MKITLCGSTRFRDQFELWNKRLTLAGFVVYSVAGFGHSGDSFTPAEKELLDLVHLRKIAESDAIAVIDIDGYIGDSTRREIAWAKMNGKHVYYVSFANNPTIYQLRTGSARPLAFDWEPQGDGLHKDIQS